MTDEQVQENFKLRSRREKKKRETREWWMDEMERSMMGRELTVEDETHRGIWRQKIAMG